MKIKRIKAQIFQKKDTNMKEKIKKGHIIFNKTYKLTKRNKITKQKIQSK